MKFQINQWLMAVVGVSLITVSATANQRLEDRVLRKSERVNNLLNRHSQDLSRQELRSVLKHLKDIIVVIREGDDSGGGGYGSLYSAECHIDDDPQFDYGQNVVGTVSGRRLANLVSECASLAEASYGSRGSSGLKNLTTDMNRIPNNFQVAICQVDDDPDFDLGQMTVGTLADESIEQMIADCSSVAKSMYGAKGSSGLTKLNANRSVPGRGYKSAECWLDDDPDFDAGQVFAGKIWGRTTRDLITQCSALAESQYSGKGSSGLKNVQ